MSVISLKKPYAAAFYQIAGNRVAEPCNNLPLLAFGHHAKYDCSAIPYGHMYRVSQKFGGAGAMPP